MTEDEQYRKAKRAVLEQLDRLVNKVLPNLPEQLDEALEKDLSELQKVLTLLNRMSIVQLEKLHSWMVDLEQRIIQKPQKHATKAKVKHALVDLKGILSWPELLELQTVLNKQEEAVLVKVSEVDNSEEMNVEVVLDQMVALELWEPLTRLGLLETD